MDTQQVFDIRTISFYLSGNSFYGSCERLRYQIKPSEGRLEAAVWKGPLCSEKSEMLCQQTFEATGEGLERLKKWLAEQVETMG